MTDEKLKSVVNSDSIIKEIVWAIAAYRDYYSFIQKEKSWFSLGFIKKRKLERIMGAIEGLHKAKELIETNRENCRLNAMINKTVKSAINL